MVWYTGKSTKDALLCGFVMSILILILTLYYIGTDLQTNTQPISKRVTIGLRSGGQRNTTAVDNNVDASRDNTTEYGNDNDEAGSSDFGRKGRVAQSHQHKTAFDSVYRQIACVTENSDSPCTFPLLTDYVRRCGYFAESTYWRDVDERFPEATLYAQICRVPPVRLAATHLRDFIHQRNITSIVVTGDSQGFRYNQAFLKLFQQAAFQCELLKKEPPGKKASLDYYTEGSEFKPNVKVSRTCRSCQSNLHMCRNNHLTVSVEYIAMPMQDGGIQPINIPVSVCKSPHPLCLNLTQQEFVFKYYLKRNGDYPQLILIFSAFPYATFVPLKSAYDSMRYMVERVTQSVVGSSHVVYFSSPPWHVKNSLFAVAAEGAGVSLNDKMQMLNRFLARLLIHHPRIQSFFDLYHMQEQLKEEWAEDDVHSLPDWYQYVISYTATLLPSLP
jgi:hypothetical protein